MNLTNRLALLFGLIVAGALGAVYLLIVPRLESSLRQQKLDTLANAARMYRKPLEDAIGTTVTQQQINAILREAAFRSNARVTLLGVVGGTPPVQLTPRADSAADPTTGRPNDSASSFAVADEALATRRLITGTEQAAAGREAEAAQPLFQNGEVKRVVVFSDALSDVQSTVSLVRRRILAGAAAALLFAIVAGYLVARRLSARVKRLERAARRVAEGDFSARLEPDSSDELGQLTAAFEDMQIQLEQLDSARRQFIATASHELRTPIFSLGGFLELLDDEELDDDTRDEFIRQLRGQVERLRKLATELLDLSRLESGSFELRPEPTDLGRLLREVSEEFTPAVARRDANLTVKVPDEPLEAECDPDRVAQVVRILLDNAVIHTPEGTDIVVSAGRSNGSVRLAVSDRGLGIERQAMSRIFEPFFKTPDTPGAGLGLAIARELAERMDGKLAVESEQGLTCFSFDLPA